MPSPLVTIRSLAPLDRKHSAGEEPAWQVVANGLTRCPTKETPMPKMSDNRRKRIQAKQRKATNILKRTQKAAKQARNGS